MKKLLAAVVAAAAIAIISAPASADQYVHGYVKKDGTYVQGYYRTDPNNTRNDNYSTQGNVNPYTGQPGTKPRDEDTYSNPYQQNPDPFSDPN